METRPSQANPFAYNRWGFAWEHIPASSASHLDFGCNDGTFLHSLRGKGIDRLVGVDICRDAIERGRDRFPDLELLKIDRATPLPFEDASFDSVSILDVLEHVYEQRELLAELWRVLKDDGVLIVTIPGQHIFSWLDLGNIKFRFPRLHRWAYRLRHSAEEYEYRYVCNPDGLVGDVSAQKRWHEHFTRAKLEKLLAQAGFGVVVLDGAGLFSRWFAVGKLLLRWAKPLCSLLDKLQQWDAKKFRSTHLFCVARKRGKTE